MLLLARGRCLNLTTKKIKKPMKNENKRSIYIARAGALGSTAQTFAGAKKYLMANWRQPIQCGWIALLADRAASAQENAAKTAEHVMQNLRTLEPVVRGVYGARDAYRGSEAARRANPDAKRAKKDRVFRSKFLKKINRQIAALVNVKRGTLSEITAANNSRDVRRREIDALVGQKSLALGRKVVVVAILPKNSDLPGVKVGGFSADFARKHGVTGINMSGKDATIAATSRTSYGHHSAGETTWRNGKPVHYSRATHDNYVRSFALIRADDPRTVDFAFHVTEVAVTLPDGRWDVDANGLRAVCGPDDYHPTAPELLAKNCAETIVGKIRANAETRAKFAAEKLAEAADMEGVYVCIADSLRAGNCLAGTQNFAALHNIDCRRHYQALEILRQANGDESRVRLAIRAAISRTREENERGFANLSDHKIG